MPHWVDCNLEITGPTDEIELFTTMAYGNGERNFLEFNNLLPFPEDLNLEKNSATDLIYKAKYGDEETVRKLLELEWIKDKVLTREELIQFAINRDPECEEAAEKYKANFDKYGFTTWKDWCIENWGTKWSAQQIRLTGNKVPGLPYQSVVRYHFTTIWSPPIALFKTIGKDYPKLEFLLYYKSPMINEHGRLLVRNGVVVQEKVWSLEEEIPQAKEL